MKTRLLATYWVITCMLSVTLLVSSCEYFDEEDVAEVGSFDYPVTGFYGPNFLSKGTVAYTTEYGSLQAKIPHHKKLTIVITALTPGSHTGFWWYSVPNNWAVSDFDWNTHTQHFNSIDGGLTSTLKMYFDVGRFQIDYYENGSAMPTSTKTIEVI